MSGLPFNSWDGGVLDGVTVLPRRPSSEDLGRDDLENDPRSPPAEDEPSAEGWNQQVKQDVGQAKVCPAVIFSVAFDGSTPFLLRLSSPATTAKVNLGIFTVSLVNTGIVEITWPANTFPPLVAEPWGATLNGGKGFIEVRHITNGVRVETENKAGSPANIASTFCVG